jgi:hypothetical protein
MTGPARCRGTIDERAHEALAPAGKLVIEVHRSSAIRRLGERPPTWSTQRTGLFSSRPHLLLEESFWDETARTATKRYHVVDATTGSSDSYAASYQAHDDDGYEELLTSAGFATVKRYPSLSGNPAPTVGPCADWMVFVGSRNGACACHQERRVKPSLIGGYAGG